MAASGAAAIQDLGGSAHIVVVDDEEDLRDVVATYLRRQGYAVSEAENADALDRLMSERPVDLVVLDVSMPGENGLSVARRLRSAGPIGIIMLTANNDMIDRVAGLEVGADDYVGKPFELRELLARVRSVLRRVAQPGAEAPAMMGREVKVGRCRLNLDTHRMYDGEGHEVPLTPMEFDLLKLFATNPNKVLSRDRILDLAHDREMEPFDRSVDLRIVRLRRKVEVDPATPQAIKTVRGAGYIFVPG